MSTLQTYIVEDSPVIRENLIATLEELVPVEVVGCAVDEESAVSWLCGSLSGHPSGCDLMIVDIFLKQGSGLGVLEVKTRAARAGRNPATGETIQIAASKKIAFRPAKELKEAI